MTGQETEPALRALLRAKVHIRPNTVARLPSAQAQHLRSPLDLGRLVLQPLKPCPPSMLQFWATHERGHVVVNPSEHAYQPAPQSVGQRLLEGVAWISARRLLADSQLVAPVANLLDHLLGSDGRGDGPWLSDGSARSPAWQEVAERLQRQFRLGYGPEETQDRPHAYFAWGLRTYLADRRALNVIDPGLERLLATTILSIQFWTKAEE